MTNFRRQFPLKRENLTNIPFDNTFTEIPKDAQNTGCN